MMNRALLLTASLAAACLLAACAGPAAAYIKAPPQTLGSMCLQPDHISVLRVEKVSAENGVIVFKHAEELKGTHDGSPMKHVIKPDVKGAKVILDWAAEGKTAVMFYFTGGNDRGHVYIDGYWYWVYGRSSKTGEKGVRPELTWFAFQGEPALLSVYCGTPDKLRDAVVKVLKGEEVVVPGMASDDRKALEERRARVQDVRASLKVVEPGVISNEERARLAGKQAGDKKPEPGDKKPDTKQPDGKQPDTKKGDVRKPDRVGTVKAVADDGKSFTLQPAPNEKNKEPAPIEIQVRDGAKITDSKEPGKLAVGQTVGVWFGKGSENVAVEIQIGKLTDPPEKKPAPPDKKPDDKKPAPPDKKPAPDKTEKKPEEPKPEEPKKPKEPPKPPRDPAPTAAVIDAAIDKHLATLKVPASPRADDAEFLRRVTLDLTGRIPTYQQTVAFLDSKDPDKRRQLIDELLDSPEYGEHFGTVWRNLLVGREINPTGKGGANTDTFRLWLAEQFNANRGWNAIVTDLLTAEGTTRENPATAFLLTNGENGQPRPNKAAGSAAGLFWGVNLRCAECHNHPFAKWKQNDFWGTAAFFGKVQYGGGKAGPPSLTEGLAGNPAPKEKGQSAPALRGTAIVIPVGSGKAAGQVVKARFLDADEPSLDENSPFRPRFAEWATAADNPYFARAAANRTWAHFFGRGFVNPLDAFDTGSPSHPELLDRLAKEFADSGFDLKHLARCIATSKAYQRTSRPVPGNEADTAAFSHMFVKALTPEVLFDALGVIGKGGTNPGRKGGGEKQENREVFLRSFRFDEDASPTDYIQGIPQLLRVMNASSPNRGAAVVDRLCNSKASRDEAIATLYLTVLSRRPTAEEVELLSDYLSRRKDDREGYRGVLWILLNSSEFALNH